MTDKGRELLSQNQLNFVYYAFSDEGINYSGSLTALNNWSGSIDSFVFRNVSFETTQRKNLDFSSYLYTIPPKYKKIPEFISTPVTGSTITLARKYRTSAVSLTATPISTLGKPIAAIMRATVPTTNRPASYVLEQNIKEILKIGK